MSFVTYQGALIILGIGLLIGIFAVSRRWSLQTMARSL